MAGNPGSGNIIKLWGKISARTFHGTSFSRISWISRSAASSMDMVAKGCGHLKTWLARFASCNRLHQGGGLLLGLPHYWSKCTQLWRRRETDAFRCLLICSLFWRLWAGHPTFLGESLYLIVHGAISWLQRRCGQGAISRYSLCSSDLSCMGFATSTDAPQIVAR